ncbi:MAG TPA: DUF2203 domain-containing protein [Nitrososphaerales archaeon]|nr:DUF2203 domain-containing protein [Nitrososphaerales archaeon]
MNSHAQVTGQRIYFHNQIAKARTFAKHCGKRSKEEISDGDFKSSDMDGNHHFFTPEGANKKLPEVRPLVSKVVELKKLADKTAPSSRERNRIIDQIGICIAKLEEIGIEVKDLDTGLIDFPAMRYGEPVCLCWKLGEDEVSYWHGRSEGFRGRKPLKPELAQIR